MKTIIPSWSGGLGWLARLHMHFISLKTTSERFYSEKMDVNQHTIGFSESKSTNHRKFLPAEPSENYHTILSTKLRSVAVAAVAVAEAVANWESRLRRQKQ